MDQQKFDAQMQIAVSVLARVSILALPQVFKLSEMKAVMNILNGDHNKVSDQDMKDFMDAIARVQQMMSSGCGGCSGCDDDDGDDDDDGGSCDGSCGDDCCGGVGGDDCCHGHGHDDDEDDD